MAWPVAAHYRVKSRLAEYKRQLEASGEKLRIAELAPLPFPEGVRASGTLLMSAVGLGAIAPPASNQPPMMKFLAPGHALAASRQNILPTQESTNVWPGVDAMLARREDVLAQIRAALEAPVLSFDLDYQQGYELLLPHLVRLKSVALWLSAAAMLDLHEGQTTNAWENLVAMSALVQRYQEEPIAISELVRIAMGAITVNAAWEALQSPAGTEEQLEWVQTSWESMDLMTQAESVLAMARAVDGTGFAAWRKSYPALAASGLGGGTAGSGLAELAQLGKDVIDDPKQGLKALVTRYPGYWAWKGWQSYDEELAAAQVIQAALETVRAARQGEALGEALRQFDQRVAKVRQELPMAQNWFGYSMANGDISKGFLSRITGFEIQRSLLVAALALKRYELKHGTLPAELRALVPEFLRAQPRDPMDGKPLRYRLQGARSFVLYSVGEDGVDNGGDPAPTQTGAKNFHIWWHGRDAVWPSAASAQATSAHFAELAAERQRRLSLSTDDAVFRRRYGVSTSATPVTNAHGQ